MYTNSKEECKKYLYGVPECTQCFVYSLKAIPWGFPYTPTCLHCIAVLFPYSFPTTFIAYTSITLLLLITVCAILAISLKQRPYLESNSPRHLNTLYSQS